MTLVGRGLAREVLLGMKIKCSLTMNCRKFWDSPASKRETVCMIIFLGAVLLWSFSPIVAAWAANYHGRVIDAETGKSLEGAVVAVVWHKKPILVMGGIT